jgi:hypothetical protein
MKNESEMHHTVRDDHLRGTDLFKLNILSGGVTGDAVTGRERYPAAGVCAHEHPAEVLHASADRWKESLVYACTVTLLSLRREGNR